MAMFEVPSGVVVIKPRPTVVCKANSLPTILSLLPHIYGVLVQICVVTVMEYAKAFSPSF